MAEGVCAVLALRSEALCPGPGGSMEGSEHLPPPWGLDRLRLPGVRLAESPCPSGRSVSVTTMGPASGLLGPGVHEKAGDCPLHRSSLQAVNTCDYLGAAKGEAIINPMIGD